MGRLVQPRSDSPQEGAVRPGIAERLWQAARGEFSQRGYHGARVQGIARRAGCNVALLYRHWASKKALYVDILKTVWISQARDIQVLLDQGGGAPGVVAAYLDALLKDPLGSEVMVRELLDGAPFLSQLIEAEPALVEPLRTAAVRLLAQGTGNGNASPALRPGLDPAMVVLTVGGLAALVSSARDVAQLFTGRAITSEEWRAHLHDILVHGIVPFPA
jgi:TetR/AcrR family transcriptional regulator